MNTNYRIRKDVNLDEGKVIGGSKQRQRIIKGKGNEENWKG